MSTSGNVLSVDYRYLDMTEYWFASLLRVGVDGHAVSVLHTSLHPLSPGERIGHVIDTSGEF